MLDHLLLVLLLSCVIMRMVSPWAATSCLLSSRTPGSDRSNYYGMSRSVLHIGPPASSAEPQEFLPADHSIAAFASSASMHIFSYAIYNDLSLTVYCDKHLKYGVAEL